MKSIIFAFIALNLLASSAYAVPGETRKQKALRSCIAKGGTLVEHKRTLGGKNASYYGNEFVGRTMACGGRFSQGGSTAAIKVKHMLSGLVPCGTMVTVTRTDITNNGNPVQTTVRITDNGPLTPARVIDLPTAVARRLGFGPGRSGEVPVLLEWTAYSCQ